MTFNFLGCYDFRSNFKRLLFQVTCTRLRPNSKRPDKPTTKMSEPQSPTNDAVKEVMEDNTGDSNLPTDFNLDKLRTSFEICLTEDGKILLKNYITGFEELCKFLKLLGTVFGWVFD